MYRTGILFAFAILLFLPASPAYAQQSKISWTKFPGAATEIDVGADGTVWIIGAKKVSGENFGIFRWNGKEWQRMPGWATRIAVGPRGNAWVLNDRHEIWRWDSNKWVRLPGLASDIDIGADGTAWIIGTNNAVYRWTGRKWDNSAGGGGARIAVGPKGRPSIVNPDRSIFSLTKSGWQRVPGSAREISIGSDGRPWVIGVNKVGKDFGVWRRDTKWIQQGGALSRISAGGDGNLWGLKADNSIFRGKIAKQPLSKKVIARLKADLAKNYPNIVKSIKFPRGYMQGSDIFIDQTINDQKVSIVIYTPTGKKDRNIAIIAEKADLGALLKGFGIPDFFPLGLRHASLVFVPLTNAQTGLATSRLPAVLAKPIGKVASRIDLKVGLNLFSRLQANSKAAGIRLLKTIGLPKSLDDVTVEASFGLGNVLTLKKRTPWKNPYGLKSITLDGVVLQASRGREPDPDAIRTSGKSGKQLPKFVRLSGWGNTKIKGKTYFLFAQHVSVDGAPVGIGYGIDAKSITLRNAVDIAATMPFMNAKALAGARSAPLSQVRIDNLRYRKSRPTAYDPPRFEDMLIVAATPNVTLPDQKPLPGFVGQVLSGTPGPLLYASGKGIVFGEKAGIVDSRIDLHGVHMRATLRPRKIGPIPYSGSLAFRVTPVGSATTFDHEVTLKGKANLHGLKNVDLVLKADSKRVRYLVPGKCPLTHYDMAGSSPLNDLAKIKKFTVRYPPRNCFAKGNLNPIEFAKKLRLAGKHIDGIWGALAFAPGGNDPANRARWLIHGGYSPKSVKDVVWVVGHIHDGAAIAGYFKNAGVHIDAIWDALRDTPDGRDIRRVGIWLARGGFHPVSVKNALWVKGRLHDGAAIAGVLGSAGVHIDSTWDALQDIDRGIKPASLAVWLKQGGYSAGSVKDALWNKGGIKNAKSILKMLKGAGYPKGEVKKAVKSIAGAKKEFCKVFRC